MLAVRKAEIMVAATQLFQHYGYAKTTVADIAKEAGIGVGTVYLEFSSKDAIVGALAEQSREAVRAAMQAVIDSSGSYSERLVRIVETRLDSLRSFVTQGLHGSDLLFSEGWEAIAKGEEDLLTSFLDAGQQAGAFTIVNTRLTARVILKASDCLCPATQTKPKSARDELTSMHALVLGGVVSRLS